MRISFPHFMTTTDLHFPQMPLQVSTLVIFNSLQEIVSASQTIKRLKGR